MRMAILSRKMPTFGNICQNRIPNAVPCYPPMEWIRIWGGLVGGMEHVDIPTRLKDMDREGIDVSVLFPTSSFAVNSFIERDYAVAYARAYNDFIAEVCRQSPRLKGIALLPFQDPAAAVQEANRAITKLGLAA